MKNLVVLSLILLISTTIAIQSQQGKLDLKNEKIISSPLSKALLNMVQLQQSLKTEEGEERLFTALEFLSANIGAKRDAENAQFGTDQDNYARDVSRVSEIVNECQGQITILNEAIAIFTNEGESLQFALASQRQQLEVVSGGQKAENTYLENLNAQYQQDTNDQQDVIDLLGQAIDKLTEAAGLQVTTWSSFLETNSQTFTGFAENLKMKVKKVKQQSLYQPIVKLFVMLTTTETDPDPSSLKRAQIALEDLRTYYANAQQQLSVVLQASVDEHSILIDQLNSEVDRFVNVEIPRIEASIAANDNNLSAQQSALYVENADLLAAQELLVTLAQAFAERQTLYQRLTDEYSSELTIVQEVQSICSQAYNK